MDIDRVLGFEAPTVSDWSIIESGPGTLSTSTTLTQGSRSLAITAHGYVSVQSVALPSLGSRVGSAIHYDIMAPSELKRENPYWYGATQMFVSIPSLGLNKAYLGQVELTPLPLGQWNTVTFTPSSDVLTKLRRSYTDLRVIVVVNAPNTATKPYLVDNLRFDDKTLAWVTVSDGSGQPISGLTVVAYNGSTPTSNSGVTDSSGVAKVWVPQGNYRFGVSEAGITTYSSPGNQCQVPGVCPAATIVVKCHGVVCRAKDDCHNAGICEPTTGSCSNPNKNDGSVCGSKKPCMQPDTCQAGVCAAGSPVVCPTPPDQCHNPGTCDLTTDSCSYPNKNDGTPCDDKNACTQSDACQAGVCASGSSVPCPIPDQCHNPGTCDPGTGSCSNPIKDDGIACGVGTGCVEPDVCSSGSCVPKSGPDCTPTTPGPFGDFHCLLDGSYGASRLTLRTGTTTEQWQLRGTMDLAFQVPYFTVTGLTALGLANPNDATGAAMLEFHRVTFGVGSVDTSTGKIEVGIPITIIRPDQTTVAVNLAFQGTIANRIVSGKATAPALPGTTVPAAEVSIVCRQQFMDAFVAVDYQIGTDGSVTAGSPSIFNGAATVPLMRVPQTQDGPLIETRTSSGEVLDQFASPRLGETPASTSSEAMSIRVPFSNQIRTILVRDAAGVVKASMDLTTPIASFCAGQGSQECDYESGSPVREVTYGGPARIFTPLLPAALLNAEALPPSPRTAMDEMAIEATKTDDPEDPHARQPSIALDKDGNAVVVWRDHYERIMAIGIDKTNSVTFGPIRINDQPCVEGYPVPPQGTCSETALVETHRPVVAMASDGAFAVAWGGVFACSAGGWAGFLCGRVMSADGQTGFAAPRLLSSEVEEFGWVDVAIDDSHNFVATWTDSSGSPNYRVRAQRFDRYGNQTKPGSALVVNDQGGSHALFPTVATARDGRATIAWLRAHFDASGKLVADDARFQRFNKDFTQLGGVVSAGALAGVPDVAMNPSSGRISLVGRTSSAAIVGSGAIMAGTYDFANGTVLSSLFQVNSRTTGKMQRPAVAVANSGDFMVAWLDDVGTGSAERMPITAQVFSGDAIPLDVDFTASTKTLPETRGSVDLHRPDPNDPSKDEGFTANPDFFAGVQAFAFQIAASDNDYALTWQTDNGIVVQRFTGGAFPCPQPSGGSCGNAVPLRISGPADQKIDVVFFPGVVKAGEGVTALINESTPYSGAPEFARSAARLIANGYFANAIMRSNCDSFNFYYDMDGGWRTAELDGYDPSGTTLYIGWDIGGEGFHFANTTGSRLPGDVNVLVLKNLADLQQSGGDDHHGHRIRLDDDGLTRSRFPVSQIGSCVINSEVHYATLLHESGHAIFGLVDEYECSNSTTRRYDGTVDSNVFQGEQSCRDGSTHPNDCQLISGCADSWKADREATSTGSGCCMGIEGQAVTAATMVQYDLDCQRRANEIIAKTLK